MNSLFNILQSVVNVFQWIVNTLMSVLSNLTVYTTQVYQVINLLPPFLKTSLLVTVAVMFLYSMLRLLV